MVSNVPRQGWRTCLEAGLTRDAALTVWGGKVSVEHRHVLEDADVKLIRFPVHAVRADGVDPSDLQLAWRRTLAQEGLLPFWLAIGRYEHEQHIFSTAVGRAVLLSHLVDLVLVFAAGRLARW